jgi:hypothetical protein
VATNFPSSVDSFTNPTTSDTLASVPHASQHADVNDAVEAIETALLDGAPLFVDDANERVGIGTTTPGTLLHVSSGTSGDAELRISADTENNDEGDLPYLSLTADGGIIGGVVGLNNNTLVVSNSVTAAQGIDFRTGTSNVYTTAADQVASTASRLFINSSGNVGIGTTSPIAELDIQGASSPEIRLQSTDSTDPSIYFGDQVDAVRGGIAYDISANALQLRGYNNSTSMTIDSSGNVGIGTTTPLENLHVNGSSLITGYVDIGSHLTVDSGVLHVNVTSDRVGIGTTNPAYKLDAKGQVQVGADDNITPDANGNGHLMIDGAGYTGFASLDGTAMWVGHNSNGRSLYLATDETARVTVTGVGNVGINDTSPSYTLDVNGDINATGNVRTNGRPVGVQLVREQAVGSGVSSILVTSAFSSAFSTYKVVYEGGTLSGDWQNSVRIGTATGPYYVGLQYLDYATNTMQSVTTSNNRTQINWIGGNKRASSGGRIVIDFMVYYPFENEYTFVTSSTYGTNTTVGNTQGVLADTTSYTSFTILADGGTMSGGTVRVYGYA